MKPHFICPFLFDAEMVYLPRFSFQTCFPLVFGVARKKQALDFSLLASLISVFWVSFLYKQIYERWEVLGFSFEVEKAMLISYPRYDKQC